MYQAELRRFSSSIPPVNDYGSYNSECIGEVKFEVYEMGGLTRLACVFC